MYETALDAILTLLARFDIVNEQTIRPGQEPGNCTLDVDGADLRVAQLPKIPLPTFSGQYEDWENFCDLFTALVHDRPRVTDATKL